MIKDKAHYALEGMPPSATADTLANLERFYYDYDTKRGLLAEFPTRLVFKWPFSRIAGAIIRVLRNQVETLALAYAELQSSRNADAINAALYTDMHKLVGDPKDFSSFLAREFANEAIQGATDHLTQLQLAQRIMMSLKRRLAE